MISRLILIAVHERLYVPSLWAILNYSEDVLCKLTEGTSFQVLTVFDGDNENVLVREWLNRIYVASEIDQRMSHNHSMYAYRDFQSLLLRWEHSEFPETIRGCFRVIMCWKRLTFSLAQFVCDFDFLQNIRVSHSRHGCLRSVCTWFWFPTEYPSLTLSPRLSSSMYVISISYRISESDILPTSLLAQGVRDFYFL